MLVRTVYGGFTELGRMDSPGHCALWCLRRGRCHSAFLITGAAVPKARSWRSGNPHPALRLEMNISISHPSIFHLGRVSIESLTEKSTCISFGGHQHEMKKG